MGATAAFDFDAFAGFVCAPHAFNAVLNGSALSLCFTTWALLLLVVVLALIFGLVRLLFISKFPISFARPASKAHFFELVASIGSILIPAAHSAFIELTFRERNLALVWHVINTLSILIWIYTTVVMRLEYRHGLAHGWLVSAVWTIFSVFFGLSIQKFVSFGVTDDPSLWFIVAQFVLATLLAFNALIFNSEPLPEDSGGAFSERERLILEQDEEALAAKYSKKDSKLQKSLIEEELSTIGAAKNAKESPESRANIFSRLTYWWIDPLLKKGYYTALVHDDLPPLLKDDIPESVGAKFEREWDKEIRKHNYNFFVDPRNSHKAAGDGEKESDSLLNGDDKKTESEDDKKPKPSLIKALWSAFGWKFFLAGVVKIGNDVMLFAGPVFLNLIIKFLKSPHEPMYWGLLYAAGMFGGSIFQSVCVHKYFHRVYKVNMNLKSALISVLYKKAMRLSHEERQESTVGEIVNLQSIDAYRLGETVTYLHNIWSAPLQIAVSLYLLKTYLGWSAFGGLATMIVLTPLQIWLSRSLGNNQKVMMKKKDARQKIMNEVLQGIRVIKFFAWETSFFGKINKIREEELATLRTSWLYRAGMTFLWTFVPVLVSLVSFTIFVLTGGVLTADIAFTSLALFNVMRFPLNVLPMVLTSIVEANVSVSRLRKFLLGSEIDPSAVQRVPFDQAAEKVVDIKSGTFQWTSGRPVLSNLNISVSRGSLVAVVGEVGSGKSSLLSAVLGDMPKLSGFIRVVGSIAYVPQQAWIQNATVKENILFGQPLDPKRYARTIKVCELKKDFDMLPAGDETEIGEKGINLSGGQKQRVSMARAVYANADVYLLDDPLSAVDAHVGKALFENCIAGALKGKTRILVTHQLQYLYKCDQIIVLKKGAISEIGTFDELMSSKKEFSRLLEKHLSEEQRSEGASDEEEDDEHDKPKDALDNAQGKKLMTTEERDIGGVKGRIYLDYLRAIGGFCIGFVLLFLFISNSGLSMASDYWLSYWSEVDVASSKHSNTTAPSNSTATPSSSTNFTMYGNFAEIATNSGREKLFNEWGLGHYFYLIVYGLIGTVQAIFLVLAQLTLITIGLNAARGLHNKMLNRILRAPTSFFDTTPVGRVLNRFGKDQYVLDENLPQVVGQALRISLSVLSVIVVIGSVTPAFLLTVIPLSFLYRFIQRLYLRSSREIQRLETISKSPIFSLFGETIGGMSTIRAYDRHATFIATNHRLLEKNQRAYYMWAVANRWLGLRLEFVGACVIFGAAFFAVLERNVIDAGLAGLSLSYALQLTGSLNWFVRMSTEVENNLVSVERVVQYTDVAVEAPPHTDHVPPPTWPPRGEIEFQNLKLRYREGLPLVLRGIDAKINSQEKVGVVGRTGAGKSSLMLALFRIVEPTEGRILIDGDDITRIGLDDLRSRLAIIPQDPTLFTGTIRSNLDPFSKHTDADLWRSLEAVHLKEQVSSMEDGLNSSVSEYGENLSVGTRQLMCLARAILRRSKILVMDEATASVDFETDELIQQTIRTEFSGVTVLTIAHRINTIMDSFKGMQVTHFLASDRVMVLEAGKLTEFDSPSNLLRTPNSIFASLAEEAGAAEKEHKRHASSTKTPPNSLASPSLLSKSIEVLRGESESVEEKEEEEKDAVIDLEDVQRDDEVVGLDDEEEHSTDE